MVNHENVMDVIFSSFVVLVNFANMIMVCFVVCHFVVEFLQLSYCVINEYIILCI